MSKPLLLEQSLVQHPNLGTCRIMGTETIEGNSYYIVKTQETNTIHTVSAKLLIPII